MSGFVELVSCSQTRWTRPDDGHLFSRPDLRRVGFDPTILESSVHDGTLDVLDGDRRLVDAENASSLARCRAHTACSNVKHQNVSIEIFLLLFWAELFFCLPVNSGKLFVCRSWLSASFQSSLKTRSLNLGMMLPRGHPWEVEWQNGTPHSMQRAACFFKPENK